MYKQMNRVVRLFIRFGSTKSGKPLAFANQLETEKQIAAKQLEDIQNCPFGPAENKEFMDVLFRAMFTDEFESTDPSTNRIRDNSTNGCTDNKSDGRSKA